MYMSSSGHFGVRLEAQQAVHQSRPGARHAGVGRVDAGPVAQHRTDEAVGVSASWSAMRGTRGSSGGREHQVERQQAVALGQQLQARVGLGHGGRVVGRQQQRAHGAAGEQAAELGRLGVHDHDVGRGAASLSVCRKPAQEPRLST